MATDLKELSVTQAATLCGLGRTTINYWIRTGKLHAIRKGRNYKIPVNELLFYLNSTGHKIPDELEDNLLQRPFFKTLNPCWEYWKGSDHGQRCNDCLIYKNKISICFTARESRRLSCPKECNKCRYYLEFYYPRIQFIHQIDSPAMIFKDLYVWGSNEKWNKLFGMEQKDVPGIGVERIIHPESLETLISVVKKKNLGDLKTLQSITIQLKNDNKKNVNVSLYSLNNPADSFLAIAQE
jgi:excisionase family DNA binding protein